MSRRESFTFHQRFAPAAAAALTPQLGGRYIARIDTDIYIHELPGEERRLLGRPDVMVTPGGRSPAQPLAGGGAGSATVAAPVSAMLPAADVIRVPYVSVLDMESRRVVTSIELLSPSNKSRLEDRAAYVAKRQKLMRAGAHLVEIDLLRAGQRMPMEGLPQCDYCVMVSRAEERPRVGVWPLNLRDRLPVAPVPLNAPDPDARLDLQAILDRVYDEAGYAHYVYEGRPEPPLDAGDEEWARGLVVGKA